MRAYNLIRTSLLTPIAVIIILSIIIGAIIIDSNSLKMDLNTEIYTPKTLKIEGYEIDGLTFNNIYKNGDAKIKIDSLNQKVNTVTINLNEPTEENLPIQIYYSNGEGIYSEKYSILTEMAAGTQSRTTVIDKYINNFRIDISNEENAQFSLSNIIINDNSEMVSANRLIVFYLIIKILIVDCLIIALYVLFFKKKELHVCYIVIALILGVIFMFVITPLSVPDEQTHYLRSYQYTNYLLHPNGINEITVSDSDFTGLVGHQNVKTGYARIVEEITSNNEYNSNYIEIGSGVHKGYFINYLPQMVGVLIGRLLKAGLIKTFLLARFLNLLSFVVCIYFAIKRIPKFKATFFIIGILPITLQQSASFSYDSVTNGLALLFIAYTMSEIIEKDKPLIRKNKIIILVTGLLMAPCKPIYFLLLLIVLCIPNEKFINNKAKNKTVILFLTIVILFAILPNLNQIVGVMSFNDLPQKVIDSGGTETYSISYVINNPKAVIRLYYKTLTTFLKLWIEGSFGRHLSGLSLSISSLPIYLLMMMFLLSTLKVENSIITNETYQVKDKAICIFISASIVLSSMMVMMLAWTPIGSDYIEGIQGRYFIPILPLLAIPINNNLLVFKRDISRYLIIISVLIVTRAILQILNITMMR